MDTVNPYCRVHGTRAQNEAAAAERIILANHALKMAMQTDDDVEDVSAFAVCTPHTRPITDLHMLHVLCETIVPRQSRRLQSIPVRTRQFAPQAMLIFGSKEMVRLSHPRLHRHELYHSGDGTADDTAGQF
jgi:hypothetical protein